MRNYLITFCSVLIHQITFAQFAKIIDNDGYANMRSSSNSRSKIIGKINSGEIVYIFNKGDEYGNWLIVDYINGKDFLTGYMHKSRIQLINSYEEIPSAEQTENSVNFILRNIIVNIESENFDYKTNKKYFSKTNYGNYQIEDRFKGQEIWGTDGTIPKTHYKSITITIDMKQIKIPEKEFENLFNVNIENTSCFFDNKNQILYITAMNSDGAGTYEVLFIIEKGKYIGRRIYNAD